jgi:hypothetical protein
VGEKRKDISPSFHPTIVSRTPLARDEKEKEKRKCFPRVEKTRELDRPAVSQPYKHPSLSPSHKSIQKLRIDSEFEE